MIATTQTTTGASALDDNQTEPARAEACRRQKADSQTEAFPRTSVRVRLTNPNHHLWNNNGTWYLHYTVHPTPLTKSRVRQSLETKSVEVARQRRDEILGKAGVMLMAS
jgi:hypothetical protein